MLCNILYTYTAPCALGLVLIIAGVRSVFLYCKCLFFYRRQCLQCFLRNINGNKGWTKTILSYSRTNKIIIEDVLPARNTKYYR